MKVALLLKLKEGCIKKTSNGDAWWNKSDFNREVAMKSRWKQAFEALMAVIPLVYNLEASWKVALSPLLVRKTVEVKGKPTPVLQVDWVQFVVGIRSLPSSFAAFV